MDRAPSTEMALHFSTGVLATTVLLLGVISYLLRGWFQPAGSIKLPGPPRDSWIFGQTKLIYTAKDSAAITEEWAHIYGRAFSFATPFGGQSVVITDPQAIAHFFANMETVYHMGSLFKTIIYNLVGRGVLWADGDQHRRQRKLISPGFTNAKIREFSSVFFDSAHLLVAKWDDLLTTSGQVDDGFVTDVQHWLSAISLDTIGITGFSHDFQALSGGRGEIVQAFEQLSNGSINVIDALAIIVGDVFPFLSNIPTPRQQAVTRMNKACGVLARELLERSRGEKVGYKGDKSVMGLLIQAESTATDMTTLEEEVIAQMRTIMVAGYETTSTSLTWALIELCRRIDIQQELRDEITKAFPLSDPSHEDLSNSTTLPLLDAVVHETLRLHPPVTDTPRTAIKDDVIPFSRPITLLDGTSIDRLPISKGQTVVVPLHAINRSRVFWGDDASTFQPSRWLAGDLGKAEELSSYRHITTFIDGPKTCLGKSFAVVELKAVILVLIRKFAFEFPNGPETPVVLTPAIVLRPKVEGEVGAKVPLRIKRID